MIAKARVCELHQLDGRSRPVYYYLLLFSYVDVYARVKDNFLTISCCILRCHSYNFNRNVWSQMHRCTVCYVNAMATLSA